MAGFARKKTAGAVLVASDSAANGSLVKRLLDEEFQSVQTSVLPDSAAADFRRAQPPDVLVLAFPELAQAERHYLGLFRHADGSQHKPHRTVLLCSKDELHQAYELCREDLFDDYVPFWPVAHDAHRLPMAVHRALRELHGRQNEQPSSQDFAARARGLAELETLLQQRMRQDGELVAIGGRAGDHAQQQIDRAFGSFSTRVGAARRRDRDEDLHRELERLRQEAVELSRLAIDESVKPLRDTAAAFRTACERHLKTVQALAELAGEVRPLLLVVDDDTLQRETASEILGDDYRLDLAASGTAALAVLRERRPDLVLLDVIMPGIGGLDVLHQLHASPQWRDIPVIMVSGKSEKHIVMESLKSGAVDFIVKPYDPEILLAKIGRVLGREEPPPG